MRGHDGVYCRGQCLRNKESEKYAAFQVSQALQVQAARISLSMFVPTGSCGCSAKSCFSYILIELS